MSGLADGFPLFEFDAGRTAVFEPAATQPDVDAPSPAVGCFLPEEITEAVEADGQRIMELPSREPLWETRRDDRRLGVFYPGQGASLAACELERVIAAGCRTVVFCGGAGALVSELILGDVVVVVTSAVRDEGTSFHCAPPGREISSSPQVVRVLQKTCEQADVPWTVGKSWSTDGIFRETPRKVARRRDEGCLTVECEASALFAVGAFRNVQVGVLLYAGDDLSSGTRDSRDWTRAFHTRRRLFDLAADAALALDDMLPRS